MRIHLLILSLATLMSARADIDLTPHLATARFGGFAASRIQFTEGGKKIAISVDSDAEVSAGGGGTLVRFKGIPRATVVFQRSSLSPSVAFDAEGLVQYQKAAVQLLPGSAEAVKLETPILDAESINGGHSLRLDFTFEIAKAPMRESIIFLNIDDRQQIVVHTGAFAKDFEAAYARASRMIRDWHELSPSEEKGEN